MTKMSPTGRVFTGVTGSLRSDSGSLLTTTLLFVVCASAAVVMGGCATLLDPIPYAASRDWARAYEVLEVNLINNPGSESEAQACALADKHPEILDHAAGTFSPEALAKWGEVAGNVTWQVRRVSAFCLIATPDQCLMARNNVSEAGRGIKPRFLAAADLYSQLSDAERQRLSSAFSVKLFKDDEVGIVTDRQHHHEATAGSSSGSALGAAVGSAAYVDRSFSGRPSGWNYSASNHLAAQLVGATVGGALLNKEATEQYRFRYAVRTRSGKLIQQDDVSTTSIGQSLGACVEIQAMKPLEDEICTETLAGLRKRLQPAP